MELEFVLVVTCCKIFRGLDWVTMEKNQYFVGSLWAIKQKNRNKKYKDWKEELKLPLFMKIIYKIV